MRELLGVVVKLRVGGERGPRVAAPEVGVLVGLACTPSHTHTHTHRHHHHNHNDDDDDDDDDADDDKRCEKRTSEQ